MLAQFRHFMTNELLYTTIKNFDSLDEKDFIEIETVLGTTTYKIQKKTAHCLDIGGKKVNRLVYLILETP